MDLKKAFKSFEKNFEKEVLQKIGMGLKNESKRLQNEVKERTVGYIAGGLGIVAGLAWNDAIKAMIEYYFPLEKSGLLAQFVYAIIITVVVVIFTVYLLRLFKVSGKK